MFHWKHEIVELKANRKGQSIFLSFRFISFIEQSKKMSKQKKTFLQFLDDLLLAIKHFYFSIIQSAFSSLIMFLEMFYTIENVKRWILNCRLLLMKTKHNEPSIINIFQKIPLVSWIHICVFIINDKQQRTYFIW